MILARSTSYFLETKSLSFVERAGTCQCHIVGWLAFNDTFRLQRNKARSMSCHQYPECLAYSFYPFRWKELLWLHWRRLRGEDSGGRSPENLRWGTEVLTSPNIS